MQVSDAMQALQDMGMQGVLIQPISEPVDGLIILATSKENDSEWCILQASDTDFNIIGHYEKLHAALNSYNALTRFKNIDIGGFKQC